MFNHLKRDFNRCGNTFRERIREMVLNPGMWAVIGYRYRRWVFASHLPRPIRWPFSLVAMIVQLWTEITTSIQLSTAAEIGPGLYIPHTGTIVVGSGSKIGSNCTLCHGVTVGHREGGQRGTTRPGNPVIANRVYIGPSSAIVGPITVGEDSLVGIGAIVTRSVPARGVVVGNPARILSHQGSFDLICYPGMDRDPGRIASLSLLNASVLETRQGFQPTECVNGVTA